MSGGNWNYMYHQMDYASGRLLECKNPARKAFGDLMARCAKAMHDIEWVDSGDMGEGDDIEAIMKCITHEDVFKASVQELKDCVKKLEEITGNIG